MVLIVWNESLSVGYELIDEQHKRLIELINLTHDSITNDRGEEAIGQVLNELVEYTRSHFATEERLMQEYGYPLADSHKRMHLDLLRSVVTARGRLASGQSDVAEKVYEFLQDWVATHIQKSDKTLGSFLATKSLGQPLAIMSD